MPSKKTIHKIGAKTINIHKQSQDKCRISIILSICANDKKLFSKEQKMEKYIKI